MGDMPDLVRLAANGVHWLVLAERAAMPAWHEEGPPPLPEFATVVMNNGWQTMLSGREGRELEQRVLPVYLAQRRWFAAKDDRIKLVRICAASEVASAIGNLVLLQSEVTLAKDREVQRYLLPLGLSW